MSSLPEEIEVDIFLRVPVQSILACKYVCKPWFNLISSSKFIKDHLARNNNNHRFMQTQKWHSQKHWIWSMDFASLSSSSGTCKRLEAVPMNCPFRYDRDSRIRILGSCNGLICLGIYTPSYALVPPPDGICVWNPATREYKDMPLPSYPSDLRGSCYDKDIVYGFGYDCSIDNYKLVKIAHYRNSGHIKGEVHTLGSDVWKPTILGDSTCYSFLYTCYPGLLLNGALHWLGGVTTNQQNSYKLIILSFNISSETRIDFPVTEETMRGQNNNLGALNDCLCLLSLSRVGCCFHVWVMLNYGVTESWTKQFTFTYNRPLYDHYLQPLLSLQNGEILMHLKSDFILHDPNVGSIRNLEVSSQGAVLEDGGFVYAESLVSLNSGNYVGRRKRTRTYMQALIGNQNT